MKEQTLIYSIVAEFLSSLKADGYTIGINKHLQIQTLLKQLPDETDTEALKLALVPLIAQSPQEQERLYESFDQCVKRIEEQQPSPCESTPSVSNDPKRKLFNLWEILMAVLLLTLLIGVGIYGYLENQKKKIQPTETPQLPINTPSPHDTVKIDNTKPDTANVSYFVENKPYPFPNHLDDYDIDVSPTQLWLSDNWVWLRWLLATILTALCLALSLAFNAFVAASVSQPLVKINSASASRVPDVDGGP